MVWKGALLVQVDKGVHMVQWMETGCGQRACMMIVVTVTSYSKRDRFLAQGWPSNAQGMCPMCVYAVIQCVHGVHVKAYDLLRHCFAMPPMCCVQVLHVWSPSIPSCGRLCMHNRPFKYIACLQSWMRQWATAELCPKCAAGRKGTELGYCSLVVTESQS